MYVSCSVYSCAIPVTAYSITPTAQMRIRRRKGVFLLMEICKGLSFCSMSINAYVPSSFAMAAAGSRNGQGVRLLPSAFCHKNSRDGMDLRLFCAAFRLAILSNGGSNKNVAKIHCFFPTIIAVHITIFRFPISFAVFILYSMARGMALTILTATTACPDSNVISLGRAKSSNKTIITSIAIGN